MGSSVFTECETSRRIVTWNEVHEIIGRICQEISVDDVDVICGISVGGLVPAALFSIELKEKNVVTLSCRSYNGFDRGEVIISNGPEISALKGKRVLLVDDIMDSGNTISKVRRHLLECYAVQSVEVAVIYLNTINCKEERPTHWGRKTTDWIIFPWEQAYFTSAKSGIV